MRVKQGLEWITQSVAIMVSSMVSTRAGSAIRVSRPSVNARRRRLMKLPYTVVTRDGRYRSLGYVENAECKSAAVAAVVGVDETRLSGQPGAESFQTVCGVIVGSGICP